MIANAAWCIVALGLLGLAGAMGFRHFAARHVIYVGSAVLSLLLLIVGCQAIGGPVDRMALPIGSALSTCRLRVDALSGFFLILIGLGATGASIFALGYGRHEVHPGRILPFYPMFIGAMALVVVADDAFTFLFAWELMSLASWALVAAHHREPGNAQASFVYLVMAAFSGMTLLLAFGLLAGTQGAYAFDAIRTAHPSLWIATFALVVALIGTAAKAGLVPLHVWLPLAHPAAPSHVSALMSGVMTKVAIYGFIRIAFDLLGAADWWTGTVVLIAGSVTAVLGVLQAVFENDTKRLLAYSTIENIGIIFIGLGLALAFRANDFAIGAALALTAALLHALNHTLFKSLLFLGAGAVLQATGQRRLTELGGLIHRMPQTTAVVLVGCLAIAGLPPLNGFVSEWLTFQAILLRPELPQWGLKLMIPVSGAMLALTAALAACCFVRFFGVGFLGRPRSHHAEQAREVDGWSLTAMAAFGGACVLAGIFPGWLIDAVAPVTQALTGNRMPAQFANAWLAIAPAGESRSSYDGLLVFCFIASSMLLTLALLRRFSAGLRRGPAWDCGFPEPSPATQYTGASFDQPIRRVFAYTIFGARDAVDMPRPGDMRPAGITRSFRDPIWDGFYLPLGRLVGAIATQANVLQFLTIRRYLAFVFAALVILLLTLTLWQ